MATLQLISRFDLRALLVVAALCTLCISNNVGPSFLPIPVVTDPLVANSQVHHRDTVSGLPLPVEADAFRVPIMGHTQKRVVKEPQPQPFAAMPKVGVVLLNDVQVAAEFNTQIPLFTSASVSQPPGRAPPRFA